MGSYVSQYVHVFTSFGRYPRQCPWFCVNIFSRCLFSALTCIWQIAEDKPALSYLANVVIMKFRPPVWPLSVLICVHIFDGFFVETLGFFQMLSWWQTYEAGLRQVACRLSIAVWLLSGGSAYSFLFRMVDCHISCVLSWQYCNPRASGSRSRVLVKV